MIARSPAARRADLALLALIAAYALGYTVLCWLRFATFHAQIDMSYYLRLIWGIGHGHLDLPLVGARHFIGLHLEPVVFPLSALSALGAPLAPLLLGLQAVAVAYLAWPAYRLGERHLGPGLPALLTAAVALLYPTVTVATLHDFHPVTLALAPLLGVIDALDERALGRALLLGALALACREDIALQLAALCALCALGALGGAYPPRVRAAAALLGAALCAYFFLYVLWLQPRYLPSFGSYGLHFRIGGRAGSARDLVDLALHQPLVLLRHLCSGDRPRYPFTLLWPVALLPLLAPWPLLGALPIVGINLLSDFPRVRAIEAHYATAIAPFVLGAAVLGAGRLLRLIDRLRWRLRLRLRHQQNETCGATDAPPWAPLRHLPLALLLACVIAAHVLHGGSPLAVRGTRFHWDDFRDEPSAAAVRAALLALPPSASVAARPGLLAHVAERPRFTSPPEYDDGLPVEYVLRAP